MNATVTDDSQLRGLLLAAEQADLQGKPDEAKRLLSAARAQAPDSPAVLGAYGIHALRQGDATEARVLLERSVAGDPANPAMFLNLASCMRALHDAEG